MLSSSYHQANSTPTGVILVVDDECFTLKAIKRLLVDKPYRVLTASSGHDAIEILEHEPVDVLLTDLKMPGMTGISLLQRARLLQPFYMQCIVLTAYGTLETAIQTMRLGASDYLQKPFDNEDLLSSVAEALLRALNLKNAQQKVQESRETSLAVFNNVQAGIALIDVNTHEIIDINPAACKMLGSTKAELVGEICHQSVCASGRGGCPLNDPDQTILNKAHHHYIRTRTGKLRPVLKSVSQITSEGKTLWLETFLDITEHADLRSELAKRKSIFHSIVEKSMDGVLIVDERGVTQFVNKAACELFGMPREELVGQQFGFPTVNGESTELDIVHHKIGSLTAEMRVAESSWLGGKAYVASLRDISERKAAECYIETLAQHDQLTGLPNRRLLLDRLGISLARAKRNTTEGALLFIDLDGFKPINDTFGHESGDEVLKKVALRLGKNIRGSDTVARIGGDEFVVVLNEVKGHEEIIVVAKKIISKINEPILVDEQMLQVGCSLGIALYPRDGTNLNELMKNADRAMYQVKKSGKNSFAFFDPKTPDNPTTG